MTLAETWLTDLRTVLNNEPLMLSEVRVGIFYTAAQLSSGHVGLAIIL